MKELGYHVTQEHEKNHWWFVTRRKLVLREVQAAIAAQSLNVETPFLLDYGCGTGFNLRFFREFSDVRGADMSDAYFCDDKTDCFLSLEALADYSGRSFDVVTMLDVLEHIEDQGGVLESLSSIMAEHGQLIVTVPAYQCLWGDEDELSEHKRRYTKASLSQVLSEAGFQLEYISYFNLGVLPAAALNILGRRWFLPKKRELRSNLEASPVWLNAALMAVSSFELRRLGTGHFNLPAGTSLLARVSRV